MVSSSFVLIFSHSLWSVALSISSSTIFNFTFYISLVTLKKTVIPLKKRKLRDRYSKFISHGKRYLGKSH